MQTKIENRPDDMYSSDLYRLGWVYEVHRRSIHPAMRVCKKWAPLLNEEVKVVCDDQKATD